MSKFNKSSVGTNKTPDAVNMAGGKSFNRNDFRQDVASVVLTSMLSGESFYETEKERLARIEALINSDESNAEFVAKAMIFARTQCNLRSISHFMGVLLSEKAKGKNFLRRALEKTIVRPDDATEMLSLYNVRNSGKMLPNSMRRAFKDSFELKFDAYQLKKYAAESSTVKLKDVIKLCRPNPTILVESGKTNDFDIFKKLIEGTLPKISTAQTINAGSKGVERADNYKELLITRKLGYMAAIKNIKNMLEAGLDKDGFTALCDLLVNERAVLNSKLLPFRFFQAYQEVEKINIDRIDRNKILACIEKAFLISAKNIPIVEDGERVAILLDESGSMSSRSQVSNLSYFEIGKILTASMFGGLDKGNVTTWLWSDRAREISIDMSPMRFVMNQGTTGGGTMLSDSILGLMKTKTNVDVMIIISDMQSTQVDSWGRGKKFIDALNEYKRDINSKVKVLFWNVAGYAGGMPCKLVNGVLEVSGFSDKILDVAAKMLRYSDPMYLVKEIEKVSL